MVVPLFYRKGQDVINANYNWVDVATGSGYQTFYLAKDQTGEILTTTTSYSDAIVSVAAISGGIGTEAKDFDKTFTTTLNTPRVVNGNVTLEIASTISANGGTSKTLYYIVKFIRIRGTTETNLGSGTSTTMTIGNAGDQSPHNQRFFVSVPITNATFKKGDKIGVRLEGWSGKNHADACNFLVGHDPKNRTSAVSGEDFLTYGSNSILNIPFRIDV